MCVYLRIYACVRVGGTGQVCKGARVEGKQGAAGAVTTMQVAVCQCRTQSHRPAVSVAHSLADPLLQRLKAHTYTHTLTLHTHMHPERHSLALYPCTRVLFRVH